MKKAASSPSHWWSVVQSMADLVASGYDELELTEQYVKETLLGKGFAEDAISTAFTWVEKAVNSGTVNESLAMLQRQSTGLRVINPLEEVCFSSSIWSRIELCRQKGLITDEAMERLLEGARVIDTRDWEDDEVTNLLAEMLFAFNPGNSEDDYLQMLQRCVPHYYC